MLKPVFDDGERVGFVANLAHLAEIGGKAPGGFAADATDVYQEGLRLPPVKIVRRGELVDDVWRIILTNHRTPGTAWGDLHAMIGALAVGERAAARSVRPLSRRVGDELDLLDLLDYSETPHATGDRCVPGRPVLSSRISSRTTVSFRTAATGSSCGSPSKATR